MTPVEILKTARAKIKKPEHWTQKEFARDANGHGVSHDSKDAVCWCSAGAIEWTYSGRMAPISALCRAYSYLSRSMDTHVPDFNDSRTHAEVLEAFDRAIELAEKDQVQ